MLKSQIRTEESRLLPTKYQTRFQGNTFEVVCTSNRETTKLLHITMGLAGLEDRPHRIDGTTRPHVPDS